MKRVCILLLNLLVIASIASAAASDKYHELTLRGINYAYNMQLTEATEIFNDIIRMDPENPRGYVLQTVNYFYRLQLESDSDHELKFKKFTSMVIKHAKKNLSRQEHQVDALLYLGTAYMYLAAYYGGEENWLRAYWYGKEGIENLEKVVALEPNQYDAYLGLGLYHYYADVMPNFVRGIASVFGIDGDRTKGLNQLKKAAEKGTYSRAEAQYFLSHIHLYMERDYSKAFIYSNGLTRQYPNNPGFLLLHGEIQQKIGQHLAALETFRKVIRDDANLRFPFFRAAAYYFMGTIYFELNEFDSAVQHFKPAMRLASEFPDKMENILTWSNFRIGESYEMLGRRREALSFYQRVEKVGDKAAYERAQMRLKRAMSPSEIDMIKGSNLAKRRRYPEALAIYEQVLEKSETGVPGYSRQGILETNYQIGKASFERGDYDGAIAAFSRIVINQGKQEEWLKPWSHYYLGRCYQRLKQPEKAESEYKLAATFDDKKLRFEVLKAREDLQNGYARR